MSEYRHTEEDRLIQLQKLVTTLECLISYLKQKQLFLNKIDSYESALQEAKNLLENGFNQQQLSTLGRSVPDLFSRHKEWIPPLENEGDFSKEAIFELKKGVSIAIDKKDFLAKAVDVKKVVEPKYLWERNPPVRFRKEIPTSWVEIKIQEGKNRQVRKMFAAVDFPVLRLIRTAIENLDLDRILPGDLQELSQQEMFRKLQIK